MSKFNPISWAKRGLLSWCSYWRESLNAGQEKHDFMLYTLVTAVIIVATISTVSRIGTADLADPLPHGVLVAFELSLLTWILLYLPYKRHKAEDIRHKAEMDEARKTHTLEIKEIREKVGLLEKQIEEKTTHEQKGKIFHDAIFDLSIRLRELNGAKRYFDLEGKIKEETYDLIQKIYNDIRDYIDIDCAGLFWASKATTKPLVRFGMVNPHHDGDWCTHLDYIDAHIDALNKMVELRIANR